MTWTKSRGSWTGTKKSKFGNKWTVAHGKKFQSAREAKRYGDLLLMEKAGVVSQLRTQIRYPLYVNGILIATYIADFVYIREGKEVVEDSKGYETPDFKIKRKLMRALYQIDILLT